MTGSGLPSALQGRSALRPRSIPWIFGSRLNFGNPEGTSSSIMSQQIYM